MFYESLLKFGCLIIFRAVVRILQSSFAGCLLGCQAARSADIDVMASSIAHVFLFGFFTLNTTISSKGPLAVLKLSFVSYSLFTVCSTEKGLLCLCFSLYW